MPLGFTFRFDGLDYTRIHITLNGWAYLLQDSHVDPTSLSSYLDILGQRLIGPSALLPNPALPARIKSNFSQDYVLLAPWFSALRNCWRTTSGYINATYNASKYLEGLGSSVSATVSGANPYPYGIDPDYGGVKFYRGNEARGGNFFLVRWKSFTTSLVYIAFGAPNFTRTAMFDLVLYESGHIEFRYAPRMIDLLSNLVLGETATVGIFASGPSFYNDR
jgi:hypothetical protein